MDLIEAFTDAQKLSNDALSALPTGKSLAHIQIQLQALSGLKNALQSDLQSLPGYATYNTMRVDIKLLTTRKDVMLINKQRYVTSLELIRSPTCSADEVVKVFEEFCYPDQIVDSRETTVEMLECLIDGVDYWVGTSDKVCAHLAEKVEPVRMTLERMVCVSGRIAALEEMEAAWLAKST